MRKQVKMLLALLLVLCVAGGCAYLPMLSRMPESTSNEGAPVSQTESTVTISREQYERYRQMDTLLSVMDVVNNYYYKDSDTQTMLDGAAQGMLLSLQDPYTFYYSAEDYANLWEEDEGSYAGVGIQISGSYVTGICTVSRVFTGGPAEAAGVHKGDILRRVEDVEVDITTLEQAVDIMRGEVGSTVTVVMDRNGEEITFELERANVVVNRVESGMLADGVGYIYLYDFAGDCAVKFETALQELVDQGARGLILDLRDNPGGWVKDAVTIADHFLDEGTVCYLEYKDGSREYEYSKDGKLSLPLVVLMNEFSASASEILAGALQDRADATVVGVQSFGKGVVQFVLPVGDEGAGMQVTAAQYFTPNGNAVHTIGITPDVEVALAEDDNGMYEFGDLSDPQLNCALEVMQEKLEAQGQAA